MLLNSKRGNRSGDIVLRVRGFEILRATGGGMVCGVLVNTKEPVGAVHLRAAD